MYIIITLPIGLCDFVSIKPKKYDPKLYISKMLEPTENASNLYKSK